MENTRFDFLRIIYSFIFVGLRSVNLQLVTKGIMNIYLISNAYYLNLKGVVQYLSSGKIIFSLYYISFIKPVSLKKFSKNPIVYIVFNLGLIKQSENRFYDQITNYHTAVPCATSLYLQKNFSSSI